MKKLMIEDIRMTPADGEWTVARTNADAIVKLNEGGWTHISFDYQCKAVKIKRLRNGQEFGIPVESCGSTFMESVRHLAALPKELRKDLQQVTCHSDNPDAVHEMALVLVGVGISIRQITYNIMTNKFK